MRINTRFLLPLIQTAIATVLITANRLRPASFQNPRWVAPERQFCDGLNAPAALVRTVIERLVETRFVLDNRLEFVSETIVYVVLIALLWYLVGIEVAGKGKSVLTPKTGFKRAADGIAIFFGTAVALVGLLVVGQFGSPTVYSNLVAIPYYIWGIAIAVFYGHDLWVSFNDTSRATSP